MTRRRWTAQDQIIAEVAAACGVPIRHIGDAIGRSFSMVKRHLIASVAERERTDSRERMRKLLATDSIRINEARRQRRLRNPEKHRSREQSYRNRNKEAFRERSRSFYYANRERLLVERSEWRAANKDKISTWAKRHYAQNRLSRIEYSKTYYAANKERARELRRLHYLANRDRYREYNQKRLASRTPEQKQADYQRGLQWRMENRDRLMAMRREWYKENREQDLARSKQYREANPGRVKHYAKIYYEQNKDKYFASARRRAYLKRSSRLRALHQLSGSAENARFALWRNRCAFCNVDANHPRNHGRIRLTTEHVLALSKHGLDEADNIMPACDTCNKSKGAKPVEEWYRRQPFFTEARWRKICRHCPGAVIGQLPLAMPTGDQP
jgi:hypothetical protein